MTPEILAPVGSREALEAAVSRAVDDPAEFCADLCVPLGYRTFDVLSDGARTVITASRFVGELAPAPVRSFPLPSNPEPGKK